MNGRLSGKTAVITGGTAGLGLGIAEAFADEGAEVVCAARRDPRTGPTWPEQLHYHPVDVTDADSVVKLMAGVAERCGHIDIVVANAGISIDGRVTRLAPTDWSRVVEVNLNGVFHTVQAAVPYLTVTAGTVITVSSALGSRPAVGAAAYCSTKAAVEMFTKVCADELGARKVTVNCLAPGIVDGGMTADFQQQNQAAWETYSSRLISGRAASLSEIAAAAVYLAADAGYVNGHVLAVDGGLRWT
ncbi:SDR family NAD(P)-dependent oxidoreductase [Nocardia niigatensis]|uniref:SDR family NAD(P)-dependent oxidoreductase n=1 Tax=Nocardia niigatensis TaxID=209249 RepID=UPI0002E3D373|nr:SDR family NAD(P)-dependent oxidoreductase [Nocardia niigatensis]